MKWLKSCLKFGSSKRSAEEVRNDALEFALSFDMDQGEFRKKMKALHPSLTASQLSHLADNCQNIITFGQSLALDLSAAAGQADVQQQFSETLAQKYPWIQKQSLERAYRHCIYYATKTARLR